MNSPDKAATLAHYQALANAAQQAATFPAGPYLAGPKMQPRAERITTVTLSGVTYEVAIDGDSDTRQSWVDAIKIGGRWHHACEVLSCSFHLALSAQLMAEFAAEAAECFEVPA